MDNSGTPEGTGITEAQAAEAFARLLGDDTDSEAGEALEEETPQAAAEDASEDAEEEADQSEEDGEPDEDQEEQPATFRVKVAGEEVEVTLDELQKGYSRSEDYYRKTQALAEERKSFVAEREAFGPLAERTKALLEQLEQNLRAPLYDEQELLALRHSEDPSLRAEYAARVAEMSQRERQAELVKAEAARLAEEQSKIDADKRTAAAQEAEQALLKARPEWKDPAKAETAFAAIKKTALEVGISPEEWGDIILDPRAVILLDEAAKWRALKAKTPQVKEKVEAVKAAKPGTAARQPGSKVSEVTRAKQRLAKTGREQDAAAVFLNMLPD